MSFWSGMNLYSGNCSSSCLACRFGKTGKSIPQPSGKFVERRIQPVVIGGSALCHILAAAPAPTQFRQGLLEQPAHVERHAFRLSKHERGLTRYHPQQRDYVQLDTRELLSQEP